MRYRTLGRIHTFAIFGLRVRLLTPVAMVLAMFGSLLIQPSPSGLLLALGVGYLGSRLVDVPFARGLLFHPLARRVSIDP